MGRRSRLLPLALLAAAASACGPGARPTPPTEARPAPLAPIARGGSFAENPIVYFVMTDRFANGDPSNDGSYGRRREATPEADVGTFHGGDLRGLTEKVTAGYFTDLGVNALWITAPYEQIRGWVGGGDKEFKHYGYHGYWALDYTVLDRSMGTPPDLEALVAAAHARGIRVLFDVVMNHPGYLDIATARELGKWEGRQALPFIPMGIHYLEKKVRSEVRVKIGPPLLPEERPRPRNLPGSLWRRLPD